MTDTTTTAPALLTRDLFLAGSALPRETVTLPEMGGSVLVQGLTGKQRDRYESSCLVSKKGKQSFNVIDARAKLVALSVVDEAGARLFSDQDVPMLSGMPAQVLNRVFAVAQRLSGITDDDIEELGKFSGDALDGSSPSDSPSDSAD